MLKIIVKRTFQKFGLNISKAKEDLTGNYESLMLGVLSALGQLNIVQIGANDGAIGDPIYDFVMQYKQFTKVLLIEPQEEVIPQLEKNYSTHPNKIIFNGAIGEQSVLTLYRIKKTFHNNFSPPYAKGWPAYRASTGIASYKKEHILKALRKHNKELANPEEVIEAIKVPCMGLQAVMDEVKFGNKVDILQVDTEGADDIAIYNSSINIYKPRVINYESHNLSTTKKKQLEDYLSDNGYVIFDNSVDTLAVYLIE